LAIRFAWLFNSVWQNEFNLTIRQFGSAIQIGKTNSIWQFGNSVPQYGSAKRIQFDNSAIRFGNSIWHLCVNVCHGRSACMFGLNNCLHIKLYVLWVTNCLIRPLWTVQNPITALFKFLMQF
jgi:hypothetical protein